MDWVDEFYDYKCVVWQIGRVVSRKCGMGKHVTIQAKGAVAVMSVTGRSKCSMAAMSQILGGERSISPTTGRAVVGVIRTRGFIPGAGTGELGRAVSEGVCLLMGNASGVLFTGMIRRVRSVVSEASCSLDVACLSRSDGLDDIASHVYERQGPLNVVFLKNDERSFSRSASSFGIPYIVIAASTRG